MCNKYSIIIPVYKVEAYLEQCVNSVLSQTYSNYEIILVDDGSPDRCPKMCDDFANSNTKIQALHKINGGLSDARNYGMEHASGDYIIFLDSDDYWDDNKALEKIEKKAQEVNFEVLVFGYKKVYENKSYVYEKNNLKRLNKTIIEDMIEQNYFKACAWDKVIKKEIIEKNSLKFPVSKYSEDILWCSEIIKNVKKFEVLDDNIYCYRQRSGSITKSISSKNIEDMIELIKISLQGCEDKKNNNLLFSYLSYEYSVVLGLISTNDNIDKSIIKDVYKYTYLLKYGSSKKVKYVYILNKILGTRLSSKILGIFINIKEGRSK